MLTYGLLKKLTRGIVTVKNCSNDNLPITYADLISEKYCQCFKDNPHPSQIKNGIRVLITEFEQNSIVQEGTIELVYCKLNELKLDCPQVVSPCGDEFSVVPIGIFGLYKRTTSFVDTLLRSIEHNVNALVTKTTHDGSKLENKFLIVEPNFTNTDVVIGLHATYLHKGVKKSGVAYLTQSPNTIIEKKLGKTEYSNFCIKSSDYSINKNGGEVLLSAFITRQDYYYSYDSCGKPIEDTIEVIESIQDITPMTRFQSNNNAFTVVGNTLFVAQQEINSRQRYCSVVGLYEDKMSDSIKIIQSEGSSEVIEYVLSFDDGLKHQSLFLENSMANSSLMVKIHSIQSSSIDGKIITTIPNKDFGIRINNPWLSCDVCKQEGEYFFLHIKTLESNSNPTYYREGSIDIYNLNGILEELKCTISQPPNKAIKTFYSIQVDGEREFHYNDGKTQEITIKGVKTTCFEDGVSKTEPLSPYEDIQITFTSSHAEILPPPLVTTVDFFKTKKMLFSPQQCPPSTNASVKCSVSVIDTISQKLYIESNTMVEVTLLHDEESSISKEICVKIWGPKDIDTDIVLHNIQSAIVDDKGHIIQTLFNGPLWISKESKYDTIYWGSVMLMDNQDYFVKLTTDTSEELKQILLDESLISFTIQK